MEKRMGAIIVFLLWFLCGCASVDKGRFSLVDLDLRTPEQILASTTENICIYEGTNNIPRIAEKTPRAFPIELIFKFLEVIKGRIRILSLEWKTKE